MPTEKTKPPVLGVLASVEMPHEPRGDDLVRAIRETGGLAGSPETPQDRWIARLIEPPTAEERLSADMRRLWVDLMDYEEEHPSEHVRLAGNLLRAARFLLQESKESAGQAATADGRKRLAHGAKTYIVARGETWFGINLTGYVRIATEDVERAINLAREMLVEKAPAMADDPQCRAALVAWFIAGGLWEHDRWSWLRKLLLQKKQPTEKPPLDPLARAIVPLFEEAKAGSWPDQAGRVLTAALRCAGVDRRTADSLVLRPARGKPSGRGKSTSPDRRRGKSTIP